MRYTIARAWRTPPNSSSNIDQPVHWKSQNPYFSIYLNNCFLTQQLLTYFDTRKKVITYSLVLKFALWTYGFITIRIHIKIMAWLLPLPSPTFESI